MTDTTINRKLNFRCQKCGAWLPYGVKFCDVCGESCDSAEHLRFVRKRRTITVLVVSAILAFFIIGRMFMTMSGTQAGEEASLSEVTETVTAEEYNKIELGMTKAEVEAIIGGEGKVYLESDYRWPGQYYDDTYQWDSCVTMSFGDDGTLTQKEEHDILDAEEIQKTRDIINNDVSKLDAPLVTARQLKQLEEGMDFGEVVGILGGEGKLVSSESQDWIVYGYEKGPSIYAYRCKSKGKDSHVRIHEQNNRLYLGMDKKILDTID